MANQDVFIGTTPGSCSNFLEREIPNYRYSQNSGLHVLCGGWTQE